MYTVITVDDEPMVKKTLNKLIDLSGTYTVVADAEDGAEAMRKTEQFGPDLVITDIRMPTMDGMELIGELHKRNLHPEIVVLSGYDDYSLIRQSIAYGIADYLLKPIRPEALSGTLQRLEPKLRARRGRTEERMRRLSRCEELAKTLASRIWMQQQAELDAETARIHACIWSEPTDPEQVRTMYMDLLALVSAELERKTGMKAAPDKLADPNIARRPESMKAAFNAIIADWSDAIRHRRNWGNHQYVQKAAAYMREHYRESSFSLQQVAEQLAISPGYLSRTFKEETGRLFTQDLTQLRMEEAKRLLVHPAYKLAEVAALAGYDDYPHFTKVFKNYSGLSPSEYRKRLGLS